MKKLIIVIFLALIPLPSWADSTIEGLTASAAVSATDLFPSVQPASPATKTSAAQVKTFTSASPTFTGTVTMPDASTVTSAGYANAVSLSVAPTANTQPLSIAGGSTTGSGTTPVGISITGTLNTSGNVDGAVLFANITNTAAGSTQYIDIKKGGSSIFSVDNFGNIANPAGTITTGGGIFTNATVQAGSTGLLSFNGRGILSSPAGGTIQLGSADGPTVTAQSLKFQNGSGTNISGQNATIIGSLSTGTGTDGDIIFQTGVKNGGSNATAATPTTALTVKGETQETIFNAPIRTKGYTVSALPAGNQGDRAFVTDQTTSCTFLGALTGGGGIFCPVIFNGTAWVGG